MATTSLLGSLTTATSTATNTAAGSAKTLNKNFDMFMSMLTTQLKNQDPTNPMSAAEFTTQLTQYSGIEQQIKTNSLLETMISQQTSGGSMSAIGFLGNTVTTKGDSITHQSGTVTSWNATSSAAGTASVVVKDASGNTVRTFTQKVTSGSNSISWDGKNDAGVSQGTGNYTIAVSGKDSSGNALKLSTGASGTVTAIDFSGTEPLLTVNGKQIKLSQIASVSY